ncbi:MAG: ABC transporter substrate-binding protein [Bacillota bacterium]|nr:ABC transporter substrate-binding protein [Bacillota bacterium]
MKKHFRLISVVTVLLLLVTVISGCGSSTSASNSTNVAPASSTGSSAPAASADTGKKLNIGVVVPTLAQNFFVTYANFIKKGAAELGVNVTILNADNKADAAIQDVQDLVSRGVDGLIYVPYWSTGRMALTATQKANIPVVMNDTFPEGNIQPNGEFKNYLAFVGPDDETAGYNMAKTLFAAMKPAADGKKHIGVVVGTPGTSVAINRHKGLEKALAENPDVVVAGEVNGNFVQDTSQKVFEDLYQAHPEIKGVWAANGGTATGVMAALKNAGKQPGKDVLVVGMDLNSENVAAVKRGDMLFDTGGHWLQGGIALVMLYDYLHGHDVAEQNRTLELPMIPVVQNTVDAFERTYPNGLPQYDFKAHSKVYNPSATDVLWALPDMK